MNRNVVPVGRSFFGPPRRPLQTTRRGPYRATTSDRAVRRKRNSKKKTPKPQLKSHPSDKPISKKMTQKIVDLKDDLVLHGVTMANWRNLLLTPDPGFRAVDVTEGDAIDDSGRPWYLQETIQRENLVLMCLRSRVRSSYWKEGYLIPADTPSNMLGLWPVRGDIPRAFSAFKSGRFDYTLYKGPHMPLDWALYVYSCLFSFSFFVADFFLKSIATCHRCWTAELHETFQESSWVNVY